MKKFFAFAAAAFMCVAANAGVEYTDLTAADFHKWTGYDANATIADENGGGVYALNESTGLVYGTGSVWGLCYADLTAYDQLVIVATEGTPRCMFNRPGDDGAMPVETPRDSQYQTVVDNGDGSTTYIIDLNLIKSEDKNNDGGGYAHLQAIKGANWANTTVTSLQVAKFTVDVEPFVIETVTNQGAVAGEVESLLYQFNVTLPAGFEVAENVYPTLNDMIGSVMPVDETTAAVRFMNAQYYTEAGDYTLTLPAGLFVIEGVGTAEYTATWTVVPAPAKTPFAITAVVMNWGGAELEADTEVEVLSYSYSVVAENTVMGFGEGHVEFVDAEGNGIAVANDVNYGYLKFDSFGETGYVVPGTYTLVIPAGALVDAEGNPCEAFQASWTVTGPVVGLNSVAAQNATVLYNVNGQRAAAAKGMVVANGKVTFVK